MSEPPFFDAPFRAQLIDLLTWRRDVRHFRADPLPPGTLPRLLDVASLSPSVGLSEPWRFVIVDAAARRAAVREIFRRCNAAALAALEGDAAGRYARLKLAGLEEAPTHLAVFADAATTQGGGLGRQTMPSTIDYSVVLAIHTIWLAARAEGVGLGWVSILDPAAVAAVLEVPDTWSFIAYLCLGFPVVEDDNPELASVGWERRRHVTSRVVQR